MNFSLYLSNHKPKNIINTEEKMRNEIQQNRKAMIITPETDVEEEMIFLLAEILDTLVNALSSLDSYRAPEIIISKATKICADKLNVR